MNIEEDVTSRRGSTCDPRAR